MVSEGGIASQGVTVGFEGTEAVTDENGRATVAITAPRRGFGSVDVTATVAAHGTTAHLSVPLVPAGGMAAELRFGCARRNVGALVTGRLSDVHVLCAATAIDTSGRPIPSASVQTLAEAGTLSWLQDEQGAQEFVYTVRPDDPPPSATLPIGPDGREASVCSAGCEAHPFDPASCRGEPCWTEPGTGLIHNPRDGIVTLVAAAPADGVDSQGEPYVDANDDGVRDATEPYLDFNGNGRYDGPTGRLQPHLLWKSFRILWTGEAAVSAAGAPSAHDSFLLRGADGTVTAAFFDRNFNQLAADGPASADGISWTAECDSGSLSFAADEQPMEQGKSGVLFAADGSISGPQNRATWTQAVDYANAVRFTAGDAASATCTVTARPHRGYDPGAPGFEPEGADPDPALSRSFSFP
jgi:hypothetical protein